MKWFSKGQYFSNKYRYSNLYFGISVSLIKRWQICRMLVSEWEGVEFWGWPQGCHVYSETGNPEEMIHPTETCQIEIEGLFCFFLYLFIFPDAVRVKEGEWDVWTKSEMFWKKKLFSMMTCITGCFFGQRTMGSVIHRRYIIIFHLLKADLSLTSGLSYAGWIKHSNPICQQL